MVRGLDNLDLSRMVLVGSEGRICVGGCGEPGKDTTDPLKVDQLKVLDPVWLPTREEDVPIPDPHDDLNSNGVKGKQDDVGNKQQWLDEQNPKAASPRLRCSSSTGTTNVTG